MISTVGISVSSNKIYVCLCHGMCVREKMRGLEWVVMGMTIVWIDGMEFRWHMIQETQVIGID